MEANRAEAERCVEIAQKSLREGNREKAAKFLDKADRLCPNVDKVKEMRKFLETPEDETADYGTFGHYQQPNAKFHQSKSTPDFEEKSSSRPRSKSPQKQHLHTPKMTKKSSATQLGVDYTAEQLEAVQKVRKCRNYYEILGLEKECDEMELKKAYRRLALQFHPDKNKTPGAAEAFKAIGNAYGVLSDAEKRRRYDLYGTETNSAPRRNSYGQDESEGGFQAEFSPEEIFQMFFGGSFPSSSVYRRQGRGGNFYYEWSNGRHQQAQQQHRGEDRQENNLGVLLQLMPILILVLLSLFSSFLVGEPTFSLHRSSKYTLERKTSDLRVPYWVKPDFLKTHGGTGLHRIEQQVEEDYISALRSNCFREKSQKETLIWRARTYGDAQMYEKAQKLQSPSCDRLAELYA